MRVFISDVNDNKPVFAQRLYEVAVDENADVGLTIVTVSATDEDEGTLDEATEAMEFKAHFFCSYQSPELKVKKANQQESI